MTESLAGSVKEAETRRFCPWCGNPTESSDGYCGTCGKSLTPSGISHDAADQTALPPTGFVQQPSAPQGSPATGYPYLYPTPFEPQGQQANHNLGLILGLVAAALVAVGAIVAVVLLASEGGGSGPTVSRAINAAVKITPISAPTSRHPSRGGHLTNAGGSRSVRTASALSTGSPHTSAPTNSSPTASAAQVGSGADAASIKGTVQQHFALISASNFEAAFALLAPGYQNHDSWIASHQQEAPITASVSLGEPTFSSPTSANLPVQQLHTTANDGCRNFSGSYDMKKIGSQWLISQANLSAQSC